VEARVKQREFSTKLSVGVSYCKSGHSSSTYVREVNPFPDELFHILR